jgi:hypothetical protein
MRVKWRTGSSRISEAGDDFIVPGAKFWLNLMLDAHF